MAVKESRLPDTASLQEVAGKAVQNADKQIEYCAQAAREFGKRAQSAASDALDRLFSLPSQNDDERRRREVVEQFATVLRDFSNHMADPIVKLNRSWMDVDQGLGFYLLSAGREPTFDATEIRSLIKSMTDTRNKIPGSKLEASNLADAIRTSAVGFESLDETRAASTRTLEQLFGELDLGQAVLTRQIILSERLCEMLAAG